MHQINMFYFPTRKSSSFLSIECGSVYFGLSHSQHISKTKDKSSRLVYSLKLPPFTSTDIAYFSQHQRDEGEKTKYNINIYVCCVIACTTTTSSVSSIFLHHSLAYLPGCLFRTSSSIWRRKEKGKNNEQKKKKENQIKIDYRIST